MTAKVKCELQLYSLKQCVLHKGKVTW